MKQYYLNVKQIALNLMYSKIFFYWGGRGGLNHWRFPVVIKCLPTVADLENFFCPLSSDEPPFFCGGQLYSSTWTQPSLRQGTHKEAEGIRQCGEKEGCFDGWEYSSLITKFSLLLLSSFSPPSLLLLSSPFLSSFLFSSLHLSSLFFRLPSISFPLVFPLLSCPPSLHLSFSPLPSPSLSSSFLNLSSLLLSFPPPLLLLSSPFHLLRSPSLSSTYFFSPHPIPPSLWQHIIYSLVFTVCLCRCDSCVVTRREPRKSFISDSG